MKKTLIIFILAALTACSGKGPGADRRIITVSIAPYSYFVKEIGRNDFSVNIMVPPGSNPHIYEPFPEQIRQLSRSLAFISNGYLGYEVTWLDRFYELNRNMKKVSLGDKIDLIASSDKHDDHAEGADPHYWVSPHCARTMAAQVRDLLCSISPADSGRYRLNCDSLLIKIGDTEALADTLLKGYAGKAFMIYHPNLAYLARDYNLNEVAIEFEGKEPSPARLRYLIDLAASKNIRTIFVQREYDSKNAREIAHEIGGKVVIIDPLSEDWLKATRGIIEKLHAALEETR